MLHRNCAIYFGGDPSDRSETAHVGSVSAPLYGWSMRCKTEPACSRFLPVYHVLIHGGLTEVRCLPSSLILSSSYPPNWKPFWDVSNFDSPKPGTCMNLDEPGIILQNMYAWGNPIRLPYLKLTTSLPLKNGGWETSLPFWVSAPLFFGLFCC